MDALVRTRRALCLGAALFALGIGAAFAQGDKPLKIGIIDDLTGPNSGNSGPGTVEAAKMAIEVFGGKVLGRPIELLVATDENKPDIAVAIARKWFEQDGVSLITGLASSNSALAVQNIAREFNQINIVSAAASADITGPGCSPNGLHWMFDTYASSAALVDGLIQQGGKSWYFITVDVNFGRNMQAEASDFIKKHGGTVAGSVAHPLGTLDFSSPVLSAQASKAQVIALAQAGADLENTIKATREFGVLRGGQKLALFFLQTAQVESNRTGRDPRPDHTDAVLPPDERADARLDRAFREARSRQSRSDREPGERLRGGDALSQGRDGGRHRRQQGGTCQDAADADQRHDDQGRKGP